MGHSKRAGCDLHPARWQQQSPYAQHGVCLPGTSQSFAELIAEKFQSAASHGRATGEDAPQHPGGIAGKRAGSRLVFVSNC